MQTPAEQAVIDSSPPFGIGGLVQKFVWHYQGQTFPIAKALSLKLEAAISGFSCLAWHPQGHQLAVGGQNGELGIWSQGWRAQGFGRR